MIMAVSMGAVLFLLGTAVPAYSQQDHQAKGKQDQKHQAKGKQEQQHQAKRQQDQQANQPSQHVQPVAQYEPRDMWGQHRARRWESEHRTWQQRGGYNGYRIPGDRFHGYFGRDHGFRLYNLSSKRYDGYPRFQYNGFWFGLIDPWPEYWSDNWYENDDVYIDYSNDGYYLYNRRHPGAGIAISVFVN